MNNTKEQELLLEEENLELSSATGTDSDADILFEDTSKRSENTKHFRLKNGHYMAAVYDKPIHFLDEESGDFKDLSDRFQEKEDCFEADTGRFKAKFPKKEGKAKFVSVEKEGRTVSWRYLPKNAKRKNPEAAVSHREKKRPIDIPEFPCLKYGKEDTQTDLEYSISELGVKENIILSKCPKDPTFRFELKTEGVKAVLAEDKKSVSLVADNDASGVPTFTIPPITMLDASGITSEDAHYELAEENGMTVLSVCIDPEWLTAPERVFPVTVDPQISVSDYENCSVSTFLTVRSDGNVFNTKTPKVGVGIDMFDYENNLYAQMDFSSIPHGAIINRARLGLFQADYLGNDSYNVYRVTSPWTPENISWANQPRHDSTALDSITAQLRGDGQVVFLDVTEVARNAFYGTAPNYGIVMKRDFGAFCSCQSSCTADCNCPCNCRGYMIFYTKLYDNGNYEPLIYVEYTLPDDYVDHAEYTTFEAGLSGVAGINLHTGQLTYQYNEVSFSGGRLPLSFSHMFQSFEAENNPNTFYGRGWFPAQLQTLHPYDYGNYCAVYRDGQGKKHYFRDDFVVDIGTSGAQDHWLGDADGLGLICNPTRTQIRDEKDNVMTFENGNLKTLSDAYSNTMTFDYDNLQRLKKITDSLGRTVDLTYTSNRLFYQKDSENRSYRFIYDGTGHLVQILHPHTYTETAPNAPSTSFAYDGNRLVMITDTRGICHEIGYDEIGRVTSVTESGSKKLENGTLVDVDPVIGSEISITYYDHSTVVQDVKSGLRTVYRFDDCGHTTFSYEDVTYCPTISQEPVTATQLFEYENLYHNGLSHDDKQNENKKSSGCYATLQTDIMGQNEMYPNYLKNSAFTDTIGTVDPKNWITSLYNATTCCNGCNTSVPVGGSVVENSFWGNNEDYRNYNAYKLDNSVYNSPKILRQEINMSNITVNGNVLVASLWVNATNVLPSQFEFFVKVTFKNGSPRVDKNITLEREVTGWQYLAMPIEIPEGDAPDLVRFTVKLANGNGSCIISNPRLTKTDGTTTKIDYNYNGTETFFEEDYYEEEVTMTRSVTVKNKTEQKTIYYDQNNDAVKTTVTKKGEPSFHSYTKYYNHVEGRTKDFRGVITDYSHDRNGNLIKMEIFPKHVDEETGEITYPIENSIRKSWEYNMDNGSLQKSYDSAHNQTEYIYDDSGNLLLEKKTPNGATLSYSYDEKSHLIKSITAETILQNEYILDSVSNQFSYNPRTYDLTNITQNGYSYQFDYDPLGRTSAVKIRNRTLLSRTFDDIERKTTTTFGNNHTSVIATDCKGNPVSKLVNGVETSTAEYDNRGNLTKVVDKIRNLCYNYDYNKDGSINYIEIRQASDNVLIGRKAFSYDENARVIQTRDTRINMVYEPIYESDVEKEDNESEENAEPIYYPDDKVVGITMPGKYTDRVYTPNGVQPTGRKLEVDSFGTLMTEAYEYAICEEGYNEGSSTEYVSAHTVLIGTGNQHYYSQQYAYDSNGNITYINDRYWDSDIGNWVEGPGAWYFYDDLNRLTRADGIYCDYDAGGNITKKNGIEYKYEDQNGWKDLLTNYGNSTISYDGLGNPTTYLGNTLEWNNIRQMTKFGNNTFAYGADGIRYQKNNITYTLDENKILQESDGEKTITYHYGVNGVIGFRLDKDNLRADYYYCKNLFGDVVAIYDANGILVAEYEYDAWGKVTVTNKDNSAYDTLHNNVGDINPIRYRSYYYDTETDLYYLESRYYDPVTGRFINADSLEYLGDGEELNNYNLFSYCGNNPVIRKDPTGSAFITTLIFAGLLGFATGFTGSVVSDLVFEDKVDWGGAAISGGFGALGGVLTVMFPSAACGIGASLGSAESIVKGLIIGESFPEIFINATISAGFGAIGGALDVGILDDGYRASKTLLEKGLHPTIKKTARKTMKKALKHVGTTILESLSDPFVGLLETGSQELYKKAYERYFE